MRLESPAFREGEFIPGRYTCEGADVPPDLRWTGVPGGTRSLALLVEDPDAPNGTFVHWVRYDIPKAAKALTSYQVDTGVGGRNDFENETWGGPCPPPNHGDHRYFFRLYALDVPTLGLPPGARAAEVRARMEGHVLADAELMGRFRRMTG